MLKPEICSRSAKSWYGWSCPADKFAEHTLLVTEDGVEILTARKAWSPGGPVATIAT